MCTRLSWPAVRGLRLGRTWLEVRLPWAVRVHPVHEQHDWVVGGGIWWVGGVGGGADFFYFESQRDALAQVSADFGQHQSVRGIFIATGHRDTGARGRVQGAAILVCLVGIAVRRQSIGGVARLHLGYV